MKKKILFLIVSVLACVNGYAETVTTTVDNLEYELSSEEATATLVDGMFYTGSSLEVPSSITYDGKTYTVTSLGDNCFSNCSGLVSITIPSTVTLLGNFCFSGCSSLTSITIPESVTSLGIYCFMNCTSLDSITIPESVTSLRNSCFYGCTSLDSITIPESVTSLGNSCFYGCTSLDSITIPESVTSLGSSCFDALESVQMRKFSTEAMVSQAAEKAGFDRGHKKYWQQQYEVQRILQEGRVNTWNAIKGWFGSLFGK